MWSWDHFHITTFPNVTDEYRIIPSSGIKHIRISFVKLYAKNPLLMPWSTNSTTLQGSQVPFGLFIIYVNFPFVATHCKLPMLGEIQTVKTQIPIML